MCACETSKALVHEQLEDCEASEESSLVVNSKQDYGFFVLLGVGSATSAQSHSTKNYAPSYPPKWKLQGFTNTSVQWQASPWESGLSDHQLRWATHPPAPGKYERLHSCASIYSALCCVVCYGFLCYPAEQARGRNSLRSYSKVEEVRGFGCSFQSAITAIRFEPHDLPYNTLGKDKIFIAIRAFSPVSIYHTAYGSM